MTESKRKATRHGVMYALLGLAAGAVGVVIGLASLGSAYADPAETATASGVVDATGASTATAESTGLSGNTKSDAYVCAATACPPFNKEAHSGFGTLPNENQAQATTVSNGTGGVGISNAGYEAPSSNGNVGGTGNVADAYAMAGAAPPTGNAADANALITNDGTNKSGGLGTNGNTARANAQGDGGNAAATSQTTITTEATGNGKTDSSALAQGGADSQGIATATLTGNGAGPLLADAKADSTGTSLGKSVAIANSDNNAANNAANASVDNRTIAQSQASNKGDSQVLATATQNGGGQLVNTLTSAVGTGSADGSGATTRVNSIADNITSNQTVAFATGNATSSVGATANTDVTAHSTNGGATNVNGNSSAAGGGIASTNGLITADGTGNTCAAAVNNVCTTPLVVNSHADGIIDSTVATNGVAAGTNSSNASAGGQVNNGQVEAAANAAGVAESSIKSDAMGSGCRAGTPCNSTSPNTNANLQDVSSIQNQKSTSQATGSGSLATTDLTNTANTGGKITDSISKSTATAGGISASQLTNTVNFGGKADGQVISTADQGSYSSSQCLNISQGNAFNPGTGGSECSLSSQSTAVFGKQSQAQTSAANLTLNGGATSLLGAQAGSGAKSDIVTAVTDLAAVQPPNAQGSQALSVAGGCVVGYGCGIIVAQAGIPANNATSNGCGGGNANNCATASVAGITTALNGHAVEGAGLASGIGGQGITNYGTSSMTLTPGLGSTFQLDSKSGAGDAIASAVIKFTP